MQATFTKTRLEAFSDGVLAIILTIMVLELKVPVNAPEFSALKPVVPVFLSYLLSFVNVGIYWNNHHHLLHAADKVTGGILWANLNLLFWLSLIPFVTAWMGENHFAPAPTALYGAVLLLSGVAYAILQTTIIRLHGDNSVIGKAIRNSLKEKLSVVGYAAAIGLSFVSPWISGLLYVSVAFMWLVPDRRIEEAIVESEPVRDGDADIGKD